MRCRLGPACKHLGQWQPVGIIGTPYRKSNLECHHNLLGCRGITRSDFRFYKDKFYLLETNTQPGMTNLSLVPEIAKYKGINFEDLVAWMVKDASCKR